MYNISKYYNTNSIIHNLNPVFKIIYLIIYTITILNTNNIYILLSLLLLNIILIILSKVPINLYIKNLKFSISISIFILIINYIFNYPIINSIISILKLILYILYSGTIIYTTTSSDMTYGMCYILKPLKFINTEKLYITIHLSISFIPTIFEEIYKVYKSQISRGLNFKGNLKEKINKIIAIIIPAFNLSLKRSDKISDTLDIRLYNINNKRSKYKIYETNIYNYIILIIHIFILIMENYEILNNIFIRWK